MIKDTASLRRWWRAIMLHAVCVVLWMILFGYLTFRCVLNVDFVVSGLWMRDVHGGLVKNVFGEIAFRNTIEGGPPQCDDTYIYTVEYHPHSLDKPGERRSLSSLVDSETWKQVSENTTTTIFVDSKHKYLLHRISGEVSMDATDR